MQRPALVPASTYRLQIHSGFPLTAAEATLPYLNRLGIGAAYTSPWVYRPARRVRTRIRGETSSKGAAREGVNLFILTATGGGGEGD